MKKAQTAGQVLIFVLALFVTAAILLFGYNSIKKLQEQQQKIELTKFKKDFKEMIDTATNSYGSSKRMNLIIPQGYDELCLIDKSLVPQQSNLCGKNKILCEVWKDTYTMENAFLLKTGRLTPESFYAGNMSVDGNHDGVEDTQANEDEGFLCIKSIGSSINFIVEGIRRRALVRK